MTQTKTKPKAYMYAEVLITDPVPFFRDYIEKVVPMMERNGAKFLVLGGEPDVAEGEREVKRAVILEFRDREHLDSFYNSEEYQALIPVREASSDTHLVLLTGTEGT